jgi:DNA-binding GntR family transcriptional regulator
MRRAQIEAAGEVTLRRRPLHDEVAEWLRVQISEDHFPPGIVIPELDVCRRLGISRTPVREALKVLASERLVEIVPARGARVITLDRHEIRELVVVLARLEGLAAELACGRVNFDELTELRALHRRMEHHYNAGNRPEYFRVNIEFHHRIVGASGNRNLAATWLRYSNRLRRIRYLSSLSDGEWRSSLSDHGRIIELLSLRKPRAVGTLVERHVKGIWSELAAAQHSTAHSSDEAAEIAVSRTDPAELRGGGRDK